MKRLVVLGTINQDILIDLTGKHTHRLGGILYTVAALSALYGKRLLIRPVAWTGVDVHEDIHSQLESWPGVETDGLLPLDGPGNEVRLEYCPGDVKIEHFNPRVPAYNFQILDTYLQDADALLVNMTSGLEFDLNTFRQLRRRFSGFIMMDVHSLSLTAATDRPRQLRRLERWEEWLQKLDFLQLTERETGSLTGNESPSESELEHLIGEITGRCCSRVVVTRGRKGMLAGDGECVYRVPAVPVSGVVDTTGCGDVTGAAITGGLLLGYQFEETLGYAAAAAAAKTAGQGLESALRLGELHHEIFFDRTAGVTTVSSGRRT